MNKCVLVTGGVKNTGRGIVDRFAREDWDVFIGSRNEKDAAEYAKEISEKYGIAAYADAETDGTATIVASVNDISSEKDRVEEFIEKCNRVHLSPRDLKDAAEAFLEEMYSVR